MEKTKKLFEELLAAASKTLQHLPCGRYPIEFYDDFVEGGLSDEEMADIESHRKNCPYCLEKIEQAQKRERMASRSHIMSEIGQQRSLAEALKHLDEMQAREKDEHKLSRRAILLAASEEHEGQTGTAYSLAVDAESGSGAKLECFAWVGNQDSSKPMLDLRGPEIRSMKKHDTKYGVEPPLDRLEDELEDLFAVNSLLKRLGLNRREITVDIRHAYEDGFIKEAHSLGLAVLVAILNAFSGNKDLSTMAFSAGIRKNGRLTRVGDLAQKIAVARKAGVSELVVSKDHEKELKNLVGNESFQISFFSTLKEVIEYMGFLENFKDCLENEKQFGMPISAASNDKVYTRAVAQTDECLFVLKVAGLKGIDPVLTREICALTEDLCVIRHEFRPISTAIVVGDPMKIENILPASPIKVPQGWDIFSNQNCIIKLLSLVDGHAMGFVVDSRGHIHSIRKLNIDFTGNFPINRMLSGFNRRYAILSKLTESLMFFMTSVDNTVKVFADGGLVGRYKNGKWLPVDLNGFDDFLQSAAVRRGIVSDVIEKIGRTVLKMAESNTSGIFALYREPEDMKDRYSNLLNGLSVRIATDSVRALTDEELFNFAKEDGAVLVDKGGTIHSFMAFLKPSTSVFIDIDPAKGTRHNVAKIISKEVGCICTVNSQEGDITVYEDGEQVFKL